MRSSPAHHWLYDHPPLLALVVQFNRLDPQAIHPTRGPSWFHLKPIRQLAQSSRGTRRLAEALQQSTGLDSTGFVEFQPIYRRFALLPFATLQQLMTLAGATFLGPLLAKIIRRDELQRTKRSLGDELFEFAVQRSRLAASSISIETPPQQFTPESLQEFGWQQFSHCLVNEPIEFTQRLLLKLPSHWRLSERTTPYDQRDQVVSALRRLLVTDIQPEMEPCFK